MVKQRLRPHRSLSLLHGIMRTAMINKNRVIAACTPCTVVSRSSVMSLIITFMFEPAKLQMNWASASGARKLRRETTEPADAGSALNAPLAYSARLPKFSGWNCSQATFPTRTGLWRPQPAPGDRGQDFSVAARTSGLSEKETVHGTGHDEAFRLDHLR